MICNKRFNGVSVGVGCVCGNHWRGHGRLADGPRLNAESARREASSRSPYTQCLSSALLYVGSPFVLANGTVLLSLHLHITFDTVLFLNVGIYN